MVFSLSSCPWHARDDLDLEIESRQPVYAHRCPVRKGRLTKRFFAYYVDSVELRGWIGVETGYVDNVVQGTAARLEHGDQVIEGESNLLFKLWLGRAILTAADLTGNEQQIT